VRIWISILAHDLGVSRSTFTEEPNGNVHARCTFATRDLERTIDHDAHIAVDVRADDVSCTPGAVTIAPDSDGSIADEDFACTRATRSIEAIEYFGTEDVATITTHEGSHQELLGASHRAISVSLHRTTAPPQRSSRAFAYAFGSIVVLALCAFAIRSILRRKA
jgi:hypothetical protein